MEVANKLSHEGAYTVVWYRDVSYSSYDKFPTVILVWYVYFANTDWYFDSWA